MTRVVLPGALRQYCDGASRLEMALPAEANLGNLLDALDDQHPALARRIRDEQGRLRRFVNVYVDGEDARNAGDLAAVVGPDAEVLILPSVAGG